LRNANLIDSSKELPTGEAFSSTWPRVLTMAERAAKTILVIDDDPVFSAQLREVLTEAGYLVLNSLTAKGGMALLDKSHEEISVLIVDLILPGYSGHEVIAAVKRRSTGIKVIAITAVLKQTQLEIMKYLGADAVLRKNAPDTPFPRDEWLSTIQGLLN
jgi:CheY-like chemotaxis protein